MLYLFWMEASGCAELRSSLEDAGSSGFSSCRRGVGNRTADCAAMQSWTLAKVQGLKLQLAKLSCRRNQPRLVRKCVGSNRLKTHPSPGGRQSPRTSSPVHFFRLACRSLVPCLHTTHNNSFPSGTGRSLMHLSSARFGIWLSQLNAAILFRSFLGSGS